MKNISNKKEFEGEMYEKFPLLYRDLYGDMRQTAMCWSFCVGKGWHGIIRELSEKLEPLIQQVVDETNFFSGNNPRCVCGEPKSNHDNGIGKCLEVYQLPIEPKLLKKIEKWGFFSIPSDVYNSKKIKDRLYVAWRSFKADVSRKISWKIRRFLQVLCDMNVLFRMKPSWCKEFKMEHPAASQVKEKFGTLRFYLTSGTDEMYDLIHEAEAKSATTCEDCGTPGKRRGGGWILTLCDQCAKEQDREELDGEEDELL